MDIGVWMSREVLQEKLVLRRESNPKGTWDLSRWPSGFVEGEENHLFVASEGAWQGYFKIAKYALLNHYDIDVPFTLVFDTRTWTSISPMPVKPFRGFTYNVPTLEPLSKDASEYQVSKRNST